jgi:hypothetical protein
MIRQILPNNNERCYSNFSPTFLEVNTPFEEKITRRGALQCPLQSTEYGLRRGQGAEGSLVVFFWNFFYNARVSFFFISFQSNFVFFFWSAPGCTVTYVFFLGWTVSFDGFDSCSLTSAEKFLGWIVHLFPFCKICTFMGLTCVP